MDSFELRRGSDKKSIIEQDYYKYDLALSAEVSSFLSIGFGSALYSNDKYSVQYLSNSNVSINIVLSQKNWLAGSQGEIDSNIVPFLTSFTLGQIIPISIEYSEAKNYSFGVKDVKSISRRLNNGLEGFSLGLQMSYLF